MSDDDSARVGRLGQKKKRQGPVLGKLSHPPPDGLPREAVEMWLSQIELQLDLAKALVDAYPSFEEPLKMHRMIHDRLKELVVLGDYCLADWTDFGNNEENRLRILQSQVDYKDPDEASAVATAEGSGEQSQNSADAPTAAAEPEKTSSWRWTAEEIAGFNAALEVIDPNQRGAPKRIQKYVPTKTSIQVRDRLRRLRNSDVGVALGMAAPNGGDGGGRESGKSSSAKSSKSKKSASDTQTSSAAASSTNLNG